MRDEVVALLAVLLIANVALDVERAYSRRKARKSVERAGGVA